MPRRVPAAPALPRPPTVSGVDGVTLAAGLLIIVGLVGIIVPVLPGLVMVWGAVLIWALETRDTVGWVALGAATLFFVVGMVAKYLVPGRRLREAGVPWWTLTAGTALGIVGFFVVPVVGVLLGFVLGIYLAEGLRIRSFSAAWPATRAALKAVGWSILIELVTALLIAVVWVAAVAAGGG
jgi:uncharacterized protein YqgC (DUF456 family)